MPDNVIDNLSIRIEAQAKTALNSIRLITTELRLLSTTIGTLNSMRITSFITPAAVRQIKDLSVALSGFDISRVNALAAALSTLQAAGGSRLGIGMSTSSINALATLSTSIQTLDLSKLYQLASIDFSNMQVLANAATSIRGLASELKRLETLTARAEAASTKLADATRTVSRETRHSAHSFRLSNTMLGKLFNSIKRIAFYRMIRSALRAFTQGVSQGMENLYYWSQTVGSSFAPRMDQLATATTYLKNGFASMLSPLIERAIPILDAMIDRMVDFFNTVQELFASLTGQATWNKAIKYPVTYKDALDDATGSAKALKNILMDFDEINAINTPTSGGSGSAKNAEDYSRMFELIETQTKGTNPFAWLSPIFSDISDKIKRVKDIISDFIKFIKGLNFEPLKKSISNFWNTVSPIIDKLINFVGWIIQHIVKPIVQFLTQEAIPAAIDTITAAISALWAILEPILEGIKKFWEENGEWISELFKEQVLNALEKIKELFTTIGDYFKGKGTQIQRILEKLSSIIKSISPLIEWIIRIVGTATWDSLVTGLTLTFDSLTPILDSLEGVLTILSEILSECNSFDESARGFKKIGDSILRGFVAPLQLVFRVLADIIDILAFFTNDPVRKEQAKKDAEDLRNFADQLSDIDKVEENIINDTKDLVDQHNILHHTNDELVDSWKDVMENGSDAAKQSLEDWLNAEKGIQIASGLITAETIKYLDDTFGSMHKNLNKSAAEAKNEMASTAGEMLREFTRQLNPDLAWAFGYQFGKALSNGAQAALNMSPVQITATLNARISGVNVNDKWAAALAAAGIPFSGFRASGGFVDSGTFVYAGERGIPELMGTIGGRTAVAGGAEITGIREAIYEQGQREEGLLRQLINAVANKDLTLVANSKTGRWVNQAMRAYAGVTG